jgi:hypothetical protein
MFSTTKIGKLVVGKLSMKGKYEAKMRVINGKLS